MAKQEMSSSWDLRAGLWRLRAHWSLTLYPDAREGSGQFVSAGRRSQSMAAKGEDGPERSAVEAGAAGAGKIRRYCAANRLEPARDADLRG